MKLVSAFVVAAALALPAHAQRDAVSADLSPEIAGQVFARTVADICVPAVSGQSISSLGAVQEGKLRRTQDAATMKQAGASSDETVWDVMDGKGVVTVREKAGECVVSVYGAPAKATIDGTAQVLKAMPGAKNVRPVSTGPLKQATTFEAGMQKIVVEVIGSEPGAPGHRSRFSVVTARMLPVRP
ncbi:MAG: hypothetical protein EOP61_21495 [Sphingomonadales bacterium]|nr:MAG: hypothetical protein EOP61_21495 [Sphingomonadales bacterium]